MARNAEQSVRGVSSERLQQRLAFVNARDAHLVQLKGELKERGKFLQERGILPFPTTIPQLPFLSRHPRYDPVHITEDALKKRAGGEYAPHEVNVVTLIEVAERLAIAGDLLVKIDERRHKIRGIKGSIAKELKRQEQEQEEQQIRREALKTALDTTLGKLAEIGTQVNDPIFTDLIAQLHDHATLVFEGRGEQSEVIAAEPSVEPVSVSADDIPAPVTEESSPTDILSSLAEKASQALQEFQSEHPALAADIPGAELQIAYSALLQMAEHPNPLTEEDIIAQAITEARNARPDLLPEQIRDQFGATLTALAEATQLLGKDKGTEALSRESRREKRTKRRIDDTEPLRTDQLYGLHLITTGNRETAGTTSADDIDAIVTEVKQEREARGLRTARFGKGTIFWILYPSVRVLQRRVDTGIATPEEMTVMADIRAYTHMQDVSKPNAEVAEAMEEALTEMFHMSPRPVTK